MTTNNMGYEKSLAVQKYNFKGANGFYTEKDMVPWHANVNQTGLDNNYGKVRYVPPMFRSGFALPFFN